MEGKSTSDLIRSKLDIVDVVSHYIPLTSIGKNFRGVCPFHDDTNPSMSVSREKQIFRCFSCGTSGNIFTFLMKYENISFREAVVILANKAGVELTGYNTPSQSTKYDKLYEIYNVANKYYQNNIQTAHGKKAKEYLLTRKITEEMIKEIGIGLSLDSVNDLTNLLLKKGYDTNTLNNLGLSSYNNDNFVNRIIFPLKDLNGKIVGFSGRRYDGINENKYLNTKGTIIFQKGNLLYNYYEAKEAIRQKKQVILMEGFLAVIRANSIGVKNAVALMGTAMTKEQVNLIKKLNAEVIICFDGDEAGRTATIINGEEMQKAGLSIKVIELDNDLDPDDYILKNGDDTFKSLIKNAINFSDYKIKALRKNINLKSDKEIAEYINNVLIEASKIKDEIRIELILKALAKEFEIGYNTLEKRLSALQLEKDNEARIIIEPKVNKVAKKVDKYYTASLSIIYYMLVNKKARDLFEKESIFLTAEDIRYLASEILYYAKTYGEIKIADFYTYLHEKPKLLENLNEILALNLDDNVADKTIAELFEVVKENSMNLEIDRLKSIMKDMNDPLEKAKVAEQIRKLKIGS